MNIKTDIFGQVIHIGDYVVRAASTDLILCKVTNIIMRRAWREYAPPQVLRIATKHPYQSGESWGVRTKYINPSQPLIKVEPRELSRLGHTYSTEYLSELEQI
jgi:hypothetical protein